MLKKLINNFTDFIYPQYCNVCDNVLDSNKELFFCNLCLKKIKPVINYIKCYKCGKILNIENPQILEEKIICKDCRKHPKSFSFDRALHILDYDEQIQKLIWEYKYNFNKTLINLISDYFINYISSYLLTKYKFDYIINVPSSNNRKNNNLLNLTDDNSYDHIHFICEKISFVFKIEYLYNYIIKIKKTENQVNLNREKRLKNLKDAFSINRKENLSNKTVLLIDDVYTTGSTINEISKVIKKKKKNIYIIALTLARRKYDNKKI